MASLSLDHLPLANGAKERYHENGNLDHIGGILIVVLKLDARLSSCREAAYLNQRLQRSARTMRLAQTQRSITEKSIVIWKKTFKYPVLQRLFIIFIIPPIVILSYGFFRDAFPIENYLYSGLCLVVSAIFATIILYALNEQFVKIIIDDKGISIKKFYNSYSANWEDIVEYGRDRVMGYYRYLWRYYIKVNGYNDKKFVIFYEGSKELKMLNAHIISKSNNAKLNNISPGMIW
jgi:hypothetical protein